MTEPLRLTVAEDVGEARAPERREERGVREQRAQRVGRVPVPRLKPRRRPVLELRLGLGSRLRFGRGRGVGAGAVAEFGLGRRGPSRVAASSRARA
jgi:hypothetical protein